MKYIKERFISNEVILILGLPGSGKTTLADKIAEGSDRDYTRYDDFDYYKAIKKMGEEDMIVSDTNLLYPTNLAHFKKSCKEKNVKLKIFYFENDIDQCIKNVENRWNKMSDKERRHNFHQQPTNLVWHINDFSKKYEIPSGAYPIPVYKI